METRVFATLCALLLWASPVLHPFDVPAQAAVFFDDSFEGGGPQASGWGYTASYCAASPCALLDVSSDIAHAGSRSIKLTYNLAWSDPNPQSHTTAIARSFAPQTDVWTRYWYRTTGGFSYGVAGTKHIIYNGLINVPRFYSINWFQSKEMGYSIEVSADCGYTSCRILPNMGRVPLNDNTWYCIEEHILLNTAGVNNGKIELWVNGIQTIGSYNRMFRGPLENGPNGNGGNKTINSTVIYKQNGGGSMTASQLGVDLGPDTGYGVMYYDQFAAGNTRIGCGGAVQTDATPPGPPVGFSVR